MTFQRIEQCFRLVCVSTALIVLCVGIPLRSQSPAPDAFQQERQSLQAQILKQQEIIESLSTAAAQKTQQINQRDRDLVLAIIPACVSAVESANPAKTLDTTTLKVKDKPKESAPK